MESSWAEHVDLLNGKRWKTCFELVTSIFESARNGVRFSFDGYLETKHGAIQAYASQLDHFPLGFTEDFLLPFECFAESFPAADLPPEVRLRARNPRVLPPQLERRLLLFFLKSFA
jgi:hypothetical protein